MAAAPDLGRGVAPAPDLGRGVAPLGRVMCVVAGIKDVAHCFEMVAPI